MQLDALIGTCFPRSSNTKDRSFVSCLNRNEVSVDGKSLHLNLYKLNSRLLLQLPTH